MSVIINRSLIKHKSMDRLEKDKLETHLASDLASNFNRPYEEIRKTIKNTIKKSSVIIDIGCNDGKVEDYIDELNFPNTVYCLDINDQALEELEKRPFKFIKVETIHQDANDFLENEKDKKFDVLIINNAIHETNTPDNQAAYLDVFFSRVDDIMSPQGKIILADHYYAESLSDEVVGAYIAEQYKKIKHAGSRQEFIYPKLVEEKIKEHGYKIEYSNDIRVQDDIEKRYYIFVISKQ